MRLYVDNKLITTAQTDQIIRIMESFWYRTDNNAYTELFRTAISSASLNKKLIAGNPLADLQSKVFLYLIESMIRPAKSSTAPLGFDNYSLELVIWGL